MPNSDPPPTTSPTFTQQNRLSGALLAVGALLGIIALLIPFLGGEPHGSFFNWGGGSPQTVPTYRSYSAAAFWPGKVALVADILLLLFLPGIYPAPRPQEKYLITWVFYLAVLAALMTLLLLGYSYFLACETFSMLPSLDVLTYYRIGAFLILPAALITLYGARLKTKQH